MNVWCEASQISLNWPSLSFSGLIQLWPKLVANSITQTQNHTSKRYGARFPNATDLWVGLLLHPLPTEMISPKRWRGFQAEFSESGFGGKARNNIRTECTEVLRTSRIRVGSMGSNAECQGVFFLMPQVANVISTEVETQMDHYIGHGSPKNQCNLHR